MHERLLMLIVLFGTPHRDEAGILDSIREWMGVVVEVGHLPQQIPCGGSADIESECPQTVDPRTAEEIFGVIQVCLQSLLVRMVGLPPARRPRRMPELEGVIFGTGKPAHRPKVTPGTDKFSEAELNAIPFGNLAEPVVFGTSGVPWTANVQ
jgi:hypothetical protein